MPTLDKPISKTMKSVFLLLFAGIIHFASSAQTIILNPKVGYSNTDNIIITQIEINNSETVLTFETAYPEGARFGISRNSYIKVVGQNDTLFLTKQDAPKPVDGWITVPPEGITYKLYFPPINPSISRIDFGELHDNAWYIYDIEIGEQPHILPVPDELLGDWFSKKKPENGHFHSLIH